MTADGELVVVDHDRHADLFWALRGGGGNFGVVTSFEFDLHPVGPVVHAGLMAWPLDDAPDVLEFMRDFVATAPDEVGIMANLRVAPPLPFVPPDVQGRPIIALLASYAGPAADGAAALRPVRELGRPVIDGLRDQPYVEFQQSVDASVPHGAGYYWKSWKLAHLSADAIDTICDHAARLPTAQSAVPVFCQGGAVSRVADDATAFPFRQASHDINMLASWPDGDPEADRHRDWARGFHDAMEPFAAGVYVNFLSDEGDDLLTRVYGEAKLARLRALKSTYDPTNFFHHNANIAPG